MSIPDEAGTERESACLKHCIQVRGSAASSHFQTVSSLVLPHRTGTESVTVGDPISHLFVSLRFTAFHC
eukprot:3778873-Lingulodinium_polyedra.AAC.1